MGMARSELHTVLLSITDNVYFQKPPSTGMEYPCIVYNRDFAKTDHADNIPYAHTKRYQVTYISEDPDDGTKAAIESLPMCIYDRWFAVNQLNHDVYKLFF